MEHCAVSLWWRAAQTWHSCAQFVAKEDVWCGHVAPHPQCAHCSRYFPRAEKLWNARHPRRRNVRARA